MKSVLKPLCLLCVLCGASSCFSLDREAFSITNYDLNVQVEPEQHRLGVRGKITLRNDTPTPQKIAVLQISSSLDWRAIRAADKMLQFVTQPYTSDIDHTGSLSEAIITLPQEIPPHGTIDLDVAYEGVIVLDTTRLTRIGTPEDVAKNSDWDRIDEDFSAVRGAGYVAWYPIATESANLSEVESLFEVLGLWKRREVGSNAHLRIGVAQESLEAPPQLLVNQPSCHRVTVELSRAQRITADCTYPSLGSVAPAFVVAKYGEVDRPSVKVYNLPSHARAGETYADAAEKIAPLISEWFGIPREKAQTADVADPDSVPFESGALLLTPLANVDSKLVGLTVAHQLTHASFLSSRPWIEEGLAHFAQALYLEQQKGRQAALDYMGLHRSVLTKIESTTALDAEQEKSRALVNTISEALYRSKAMSVWWMLRDMVGDSVLKKAIAAYKPEQDNDPSYMPRLIAAQTQRDLGWFFDDWVYHDRGLPDFKVESAFATGTPTKSFLLTITLDDLGTAGAEVPVIIKFAGGEVTKRIEVRAKSKATFRVEIPAAPQEIRVNDGSVPETDITNNTFKVGTPPN
jgi:hypothetical protein